jgi:hypothetical protein
VADFWFLVAVVLTIILLSRSKKYDSYTEGYQNGYRTFGAMLENMIASGRTDAESLKQLIKMGEDGTVVSDGRATQRVDVAEDRFISDTYDKDDDYTDDSVLDSNIANVAQSLPISVPVPQPINQNTVEEKLRRSLRNLNIILYTASFLLVAAGALFIASSSSPQIKLVTVIAIITLFYVGGFIVHSKSIRLRPAAIAFLGTSLALIPFAGLALEQYTNLSSTQSWLITSLVGLSAYFVVAISLQSQLVAYLTMAFVLSLVGSMTAAGVSALVLQFVAMITVSLIASIVAHFRPNWVPKVFNSPIERSGQIITPVALVASLFAFDALLLFDYQIVFAVATLHYVVAWLQTRNIAYESIVRVLAYVIAGLLAWDIFDGDVAIIAFAMCLLLTLQHAYSLVMIKLPGRLSTEKTWITILFVVQIFLFLFWLNHSLAPLFTAVGLVVVGLTSLVVALRLRTVPVAAIGLVASVILPFIVTRDLASPPLAWWTLVVIFVGAAIASLTLYARWSSRSRSLRYFMTISYVTYLVLAVISAWVDGGALVAMATYFSVALIVLLASYISQTPWVQIIFTIFVFMGLLSLGAVLNIQQPWYTLFVGGVGALIFWSTSITHGYFHQVYRQFIMLISGQAALLLIAGVALYGNEPASKFILLILLLAACSSLALRWVYRVGDASFRKTYTYSYSIYYAAMLLMATTLGLEWLAIITSLGAILFAAASYVERQPWVQVIASLLTISTLAIIASVISLPSQWFALFVFGTAAVIFHAAAGLHFAYRHNERQVIMVSVAQVSLFFIILAGMSGHYAASLTSLIILLVWAVASLSIRWWCRDRSEEYSQIFLVSYPVYYIGSLLLLGSLSTLWSVIVFVVGVIIFWVASYAERLPVLVLIGNSFLAVALSVFWWWMDFSHTWLVLGVAWILAATFYFGHWILKGLGDSWRSQALLYSTWIVLVMAMWIESLNALHVVAVPSTLILFALTLGIEGYRTRHHTMIEIAVYVATVGMQRIIGTIWPELNVVLYAHWWAVVIALVALVRQAYGRERWIIAVALMTLSSGMYALMNGGNYQLLFLIEHLGLLVAGALLSKSWAIWWGISASALAVLYFLRGYTFLLLGFLGMLLIGIVVWRLMSTKTIKP